VPLLLSDVVLLDGVDPMDAADDVDDGEVGDIDDPPPSEEPGEVDDVDDGDMEEGYGVPSLVAMRVLEALKVGKVVRISAWNRGGPG
jgi:hypothetical protein